MNMNINRPKSKNKEKKGLKYLILFILLLGGLYCFMTYNNPSRSMSGGDINTVIAKNMSNMGRNINNLPVKNLNSNIFNSRNIKQCSKLLDNIL